MADLLNYNTPTRSRHQIEMTPNIYLEIGKLIKEVHPRPASILDHRKSITSVTADDEVPIDQQDKSITLTSKSSGLGSPKSSTYLFVLMSGFICCSHKYPNPLSVQLNNDIEICGPG